MTRKSVETYLKRLGAPKKAAGLTQIDTVDLTPARRRYSAEALEKALRKRVVESPRTKLGKEAVSKFLAIAEGALNILDAERGTAKLDQRQRAALEAVIEADGSRPSFLLRDGRVDPEDERLGIWKDDVDRFEAEIRAAALSTGRVVLNGGLSDTSVTGTAWMIAPGLAATARHVVEEAFEPVVHNGKEVWLPKFNHAVSLNFQVETEAETDNVKDVVVSGVRWASPDAIDGVLDLANFDVAVLELEQEGPTPLELASALSNTPGDALIHVIGHPWRPPELDGVNDPVFSEIYSLVFGEHFGVKRWAPGVIEIGPGTHPGDPDAHLITHDASTLSGSSGSPVLDLVAQADLAVGLHYGGFFGDENYAHPTSAMNTQNRLAGLAGSFPVFV